jgi:hypothetical protein
MAIRVVRG